MIKFLKDRGLNRDFFQVFLPGLILVCVVTFLGFCYWDASSRAAELPLAQAFNTQSNLLYSATTNATGSSLEIELNVYHTFQIQNTTLRTNTCYLDRSLDGSVWIPFYTNVFTVVAQVDTTLTGKWKYVRGRLDTLTGTNCAVTFLYLGSH